MAKQAAGSALVRFGDTMVLAAVTVSPNISTLPFFPLTVEYREKTYAAGKIPGGFIKREGRPSDKEILAGRLIDRSIRPLFPEGFKNEVQVFVNVISADQENDADVLGAGRRVGRARRCRRSRGTVRSPRCASAASRATGSSTRPSSSSSSPRMDLVVAGSRRLDRDGRGRRARGVRERDARGAQGGAEGHPGAASAHSKSCSTRPAGAEDGVDEGRRPTGLVARVRELAEDADGEGDQREGQGRPHRRGRGGASSRSLGAAARSSSRSRAKEIAAELEEIEYRVMRTQVLDKGERVDGRDLDTIRPITIETGRAAARARLGALHARPDAGARRRDARHRRRRAAPRHHRRRRRDDQVVHAALQLPAVLHRRSAADARHQPPRDRPRQPGRARAAGVLPPFDGVPVHDPHRVRHPRVERLVVDGVGLRRLARADGCRRADARPPSPAWRWG